MGFALLGVIPILVHMGMEQMYAVGFAGWAGYMGVDYLAEKLGKKADKLIGE